MVFWDLFGEQGHPIRATVFEMGPLLLSRMLDLNDAQEGVINIAFRFADDDPGTDGGRQGLVDLKDLRELLAYISEERQGHRRALRQRRAATRRRGAAPAAGAGKPGRRQVLRRAGAVDQRLHAQATATAAASSTCSPPTS